MSRKVPIKKHTPIRRPKSIWVIQDIFKVDIATLYARNGQNMPLVTDLYTNKENPLKCIVGYKYGAIQGQPYPVSQIEFDQTFEDHYNNVVLSEVSEPKLSWYKLFKRRDK